VVPRKRELASAVNRDTDPLSLCLTVTLEQAAVSDEFAAGSLAHSITVGTPTAGRSGRQPGARSASAAANSGPGRSIQRGG
jgi:hypothetical protein